MVKKIVKDIKMTGNIYMTPKGELYQLYGGWHKYKFSKIPTNSNLFKQILDTYGTKDGARIRKSAVNRLLNKGKWSI